MTAGVLALIVGVLAISLSESLDRGAALGALAITVVLAVASIRTRVTRPSEGWTWAHTFAVSGVMSAAVALMRALVYFPGS